MIKFFNLLNTKDSSLYNTKVQTVQAKAKSTIPLIKTAKIGNVWARLKGAQYF